MKKIVLHDRYSNELIVIRVDAITVIKKVIDRVENSEEEYSSIFTSQFSFDVKEHIDIVLLRIKNAERKSESEDKE